jgi:hypothetical protein
MANEYFNRYQQFTINGEQKIVPFVTLPTKSSDIRHIYKVGSSRLDKISQQYYGTPFFGWLIMMGNPSFGGLEWNIPDGTAIRVPFPLVSSLLDYNSQLDKYFLYYGKD